MSAPSMYSGAYPQKYQYPWRSGIEWWGRDGLQLEWDTVNGLRLERYGEDYHGIANLAPAQG